MGQLFGTDGIRGKAFERPLDEDTVRRLGAAVAAALRENGPVRLLMAGDTRASTQVLADWFASSFQAAGGQVTWAGVLPTPAVSHLVRTGSYRAGVVISASHNPASDNGIKILGATGEKLADEREADLEARIATADPHHRDGLPPVDESLADRYLDLLQATHEVARPLEGMDIVVDAAHGAAWRLGGELLARLGARVADIASAPDGININCACGATAPQTLAGAVLERGADGGVALDGDADRAILVAEDGRVLDGDDILLAWGRHLAKQNRLPRGTVVATVMSNLGLDLALAADGLHTERCPVGDRWVWQAMVEHGAALGGEQSGHVICSHHGVTGDGLLTASHLLAIGAQSGHALSELSNLVRLPQILLNVPVAHMHPFDVLPSVQRELSESERRLAGRGRVLLRYSGTERLARVMVEGEDADEIQTLANRLAEALRLDLR